MKESTKLILMAAGAGVASNLLLGDRVASMTSGYAMPAAGVEGVGALGGSHFRQGPAVICRRHGH